VSKVATTIIAGAVARGYPLAVTAMLGLLADPGKKVPA
jgi:hypothetical protein